VAKRVVGPVLADWGAERHGRTTIRLTKVALTTSTCRVPRRRALSLCTGNLCHDRSVSNRKTTGFSH
jgi:hypothetical protein